MIIKTDKDYSNKELYLLTLSDSRKSLKELGKYEGTIDGFVKFNNGNKDLMTLKIKGDVYVTNSPIFMERFEQIVDLFGLAGTEFVIMEKTGRSGNRFITCDIKNE